jgi:elongin-A
VVDIGDAPYSTMRPILTKIENPDQLGAVERRSPQIIGHTAPLWLDFIKRDIHAWETKLVPPTNPADWHATYVALRADLKSQIEKDTVKLQAAMAAAAAARDAHTSRLVDPRTTRLPPVSKVSVRKAVNPATSPKWVDKSKLVFSSGSKTKIMTGKGVLERARREAKEASLFSSHSSVLAVPTHLLGEKQTKVLSVPKGWVDEKRREVEAARPARALSVGTGVAAGTGSMRAGTTATGNAAAIAAAAADKAASDAATAAAVNARVKGEARLHSLATGNNTRKREREVEAPEQPQASTPHTAIAANTALGNPTPAGGPSAITPPATDPPRRRPAPALRGRPRLSPPRLHLTPTPPPILGGLGASGEPTASGALATPATSAALTVSATPAPHNPANLNNAPRTKAGSPGRGYGNVRPARPKAPVDIFMPVQKRRRML